MREGEELMIANSLLTNRVAVIATMHKKERVIAPLLEKELGITAVVPSNLDTDVFGTFTRERERTGNQVEAARLKAKKALSMTGETLAVASEGTFTPHPVVPYIACNREIVILLDQLNNLEIIGEEISTETNFSHRLIESVDSAVKFAEEAGFPEHGLVVMIDSSGESQREIIKGITTEVQLIEAVTRGLKQSSSGKVHIETDMRALYNPTRMKNIEKATRDLLKKLNQLCPQCSWPGFEVMERKPGLPCALCSLPTQLIRSTIYKCRKCQFSQENLFPDNVKTADPGQCLYCNP